MNVNEKKIRWIPYIGDTEIINKSFRNLLNKAGFKKVNFYTPVPSYLNFIYILPLKSPAAFKYWLLNLVYYKVLFAPSLFRMFFTIFKIIFKTPFKNFLKYFVPDYSIIAVKE